MKKVIQKVLAIASLALCFGLCFGGRVFADPDMNEITIRYEYYVHVNNQSNKVNGSVNVRGTVAHVECIKDQNVIAINTNAVTGIRATGLECVGNSANMNFIKDELKKGGFTISDTKPKIEYGKSTKIKFAAYVERAGWQNFYATFYGNEAKVECRYGVVYVSTDLLQPAEQVKSGNYNARCGSIKEHKGGSQSGPKIDYYYENVADIANQFTNNGVKASFDYDAPDPNGQTDPGSGEKDPDPGEKQQDPGKGGEENPEVPGTGDSDVSKPTFDYDDSGKPGDYSASILVGCSGVESGDGEGIICIINLVVDIMTVGVGILSVIGITVVGIQYLTAGGSEERTKKAKRRLLEIVIGVGLYVVLYVVLKWLLPRF